MYTYERNVSYILCMLLRWNGYGIEEHSTTVYQNIDVSEETEKVSTYLYVHIYVYGLWWWENVLKRGGWILSWRYG